MVARVIQDRDEADKAMITCQDINFMWRGPMPPRPLVGWHTVPWNDGGTMFIHDEHQQLAIKSFDRGTYREGAGLAQRRWEDELYRLANAGVRR